MPILGDLLHSPQKPDCSVSSEGLSSLTVNDNDAEVTESLFRRPTCTTRFSKTWYPPQLGPSMLFQL